MVYFPVRYFDITRGYPATNSSLVGYIIDGLSHNVGKGTHHDPIKGHATGTDSLEVYSYLAYMRSIYFLGLCFREYPCNVRPPNDS